MHNEMSLIFPVILGNSKIPVAVLVYEADADKNLYFP